jgi:hypothetical protein
MSCERIVHERVRLGARLHPAVSIALAWLNGMIRRTRVFKLTPPSLALIVATRGMLAAGIALLVAQRVPPRARRIVGIGLVAAGALSTIPLARHTLRARSTQLTFG